MAKVKNISEEPRIVPELGGLLVLEGQEIDVPDERADGYVCQTEIWAPADDVSQAALEDFLAQFVEPEPEPDLSLLVGDTPNPTPDDGSVVDNTPDGE